MSKVVNFGSTEVVVDVQMRPHLTDPDRPTGSDVVDDVTSGGSTN